MSRPVSVLIVDDSALMRNLIGKIIEEEEMLELAGTAMNGLFALRKIPKLKPDIIVLDLEMPKMNGIEFLKERKKMGMETPVIILSSMARKGAKITMEALNLGAADFILKPSGSISQDIHIVGKQLQQMLLSYGKQYQSKKPEENYFSLQKQENKQEFNDFRIKEIEKQLVQSPKKEWIEKTENKIFPEYKPKTEHGEIQVIAIGISTGGPNALREVFAKLDPDLNLPIVVVQHMPAGFTAEFAKSLDKICPLNVKEAQDNDILMPGRILIAPGDFHIRIEKKPLAVILHTEDSPARNGHRPSADVLFESVAQVYGKHALAIIMTGMGKDGAKAIGEIYHEGGYTIAQDKESCIVFGMPKAAIEHNYIHKILPLDKIAAEINGFKA